MPMPAELRPIFQCVMRYRPGSCKIARHNFVKVSSNCQERRQRFPARPGEPGRCAAIARGGRSLTRWISRIYDKCGRSACDPESFRVGARQRRTVFRAAGWQEQNWSNLSRICRKDDRPELFKPRPWLGRIGSRGFAVYLVRRKGTGPIPEGALPSAAAELNHR